MTHTRQLSAQAREVIRSLHDRPGVLAASIGSPTLRSLRSRGLVHKAPSLKLTEAGERAYEAIMAYGEGEA